MLTLQLLTYAAKDLPSNPADRVISSLENFNDREIEWVLRGGMGPLLYRAMRKRLDRVSAAWQRRLLSADLSAQFRHANIVGTAIEIIDICKDLGIRVTLLKGISISDQYYPAGHLRPMGDIDILIPAEDYGSVEMAILRLGYVQQPGFTLGEGMHHGVPLLDPQRGVWVELHTALFPRNQDEDCGRQFAPSLVADLAVPSIFHGQPVYRLNNELQLVYIAYSWRSDLTHYGIHPSFVVPLLDGVYLLKGSGGKLDWESLLDWLESDMAAASLYVMLTYMARCGLTQISTSTLSRLASRQNIVGPLQLWSIHKMLDFFLVAGRPLSPAFHPPVPGRYSLRYQLHKRWRRLPSVQG